MARIRVAEFGIRGRREQLPDLRRDIFPDAEHAKAVAVHKLEGRVFAFELVPELKTPNSGARTLVSWNSTMARAESFGLQSLKS